MNMVQNIHSQVPISFSFLLEPFTYCVMGLKASSLGPAHMVDFDFWCFYSRDLFFHEVFSPPQSSLTPLARFMWLLVLIEGRETLVEAIITKSLKKLRLGEKGEMSRIEVEHNSTQRSKSD